MRRNLLCPLSCFLCIVISTPTLAQDAASKPERFTPFELVGEWQFTNSGGVRYGGDVKVAVTSIDGNSLMRGLVSYDGRQTNEKCGTRQLSGDEPVDAEVMKSGGQYRISFKMKCLRGESPRRFDWTLVCDGATCVQPTLAPNGKGAITVVEKP